MKKRNSPPENRALPEELLSSPLFRILVLLSTALTVWTVAHILMPYNEVMLLLTLPLTAVGFGLQLLIGKLLPSPKDGKIAFHRGIPALILDGIFCLLISSPIYNLLANGLLPNLYYESDFFSWTVFTVLFIFLTLLAGIYTAMISPERFFSYNSAFTFAGIYLVLWILTFFSPSFKGIFLIVPAILITVFFLFSMNQSGIDELSHRARVMGVTFDLRIQNFRLTALMILLLAGIFFLALVIITGIFFSAKGIGLILLRALVSSDSGDSEGILPSSSEFFTGGVLDIPEINKPFFILFIILFAVLFVYLCIKMNSVRKRFKFRELPGRFFELIRRLIAFLERLFRHRREPVTRYSVRQPYQDTVTVAVPSRYRIAARSYDDYLRRMKEITDERERLCFAYGTLIAGWRRLEPGKPNALSPAMTPREICAKLAKEGRYNFEQVTELYELIRYAELPVHDESIGRVTARLSGYVEQYFNTL